MKYRGTIIEESLADKHVLHSLHIKATKIESVTTAHRTPSLKQWTLHTIEVLEADAASLAEQLSQALELNDRPGGNWYADYKSENTHFIIFPGKAFKINRAHPEQYRLAIGYGAGLGIPAHQLDFSPAIQQWKRPARNGQ